MVEFTPHMSPGDLLRLGIFDGGYFRDDPDSCPIPLEQVAQRNYYKPNISKSRQYWQQRGWITVDDPLGWFQWYCRYYAGRRLPAVDDWQIKRWHAFRRHSSRVRLSGGGDPRRLAGIRQALLHWAHDPEPDNHILKHLDELGVR